MSLSPAETPMLVAAAAAAETPMLAGVVAALGVPLREADSDGEVVGDADMVDDGVGVLLLVDVPLGVPDAVLVGDTLGIADGLTPKDSVATGVVAAQLGKPDRAPAHSARHPESVGRAHPLRAGRRRVGCLRWVAARAVPSDRSRGAARRRCRKRRARRRESVAVSRVLRGP